MPPAHSGANFTSTLHDDIYPATDPTKSDLSQPSKVVLITGSGRGIGRSIALRYAECQVACIIICSRTMSELDEVESSIRNSIPPSKSINSPLMSQITLKFLLPLKRLRKRREDWIFW